MKTPSFIILAIFSIILFSCKKIPTQPYIIYKTSGFFGDNILDTNKFFYAATQHSLGANLSTDAALKIIISSPENGIWFYETGSVTNWAINDFNFNTYTQFFNAVNNNQKCELNISFIPGNYKIEYYEMGALTPTRIKYINVK